jgi:hypothetical protein
VLCSSQKKTWHDTYQTDRHVGKNFAKTFIITFFIILLWVSFRTIFYMYFFNIMCENDMCEHNNFNPILDVNLIFFRYFISFLSECFFSIFLHETFALSSFFLLLKNFFFFGLLCATRSSSKNYKSSSSTFDLLR